MNALILVDLQNDFLSGGALAVPRGDEVIPLATRLAPHFDFVVATQDWHPANHRSFAANHPRKNVGDVIQLGGLAQVLWPAHCVQETPGADFSPRLADLQLDQIIRKGTDPEVDSYSGFFDNGRRKSTGLADYLRANSITDLFIMGLATDYCVMATALDGKNSGFGVTVLSAASRGVELSKGDVAKSLQALRSAGVRVTDDLAPNIILAGGTAP